MKRYQTHVLVFLAVGLSWGTRPSSATGLDFGPEEFVQANGVDIQVPGYSVPSFEDWNGDGLKDLLIGEGGGTIPGKVRVYLNVGTVVQPRFADFFYAQSNGADLVCTPAGCMGCFPRVVDWDQDGRIDLLVGQSDGTVRIFMNLAVGGMPNFDSGEKILTVTTSEHELDVGDRATPTPLDWNNDGLLDIVSGGLDGMIHIYTNCGCHGGVPPLFLASPANGQLAQENGHDLTVPGLRSSPVIEDFDGDGKKDILTGNTDGQILFYKNVGLDSLPMFSGFSLVTSAGTPIDLPGSLRTRPFACHWTGGNSLSPKDARWDLLVGYGDGKVRLYRGTPKAGDRVVLLVNNPVGPGGSVATGLPSGTFGTVVCSGGTDPGFPIFVSWDGYKNGINGVCNPASVIYPDKSGWWMACSQIAFYKPSLPAPIVINIGGNPLTLTPDPNSPGPGFSFSGCASTTVQLKSQSMLSVQVTPASGVGGTWTGTVTPSIAGPRTVTVQVCVQVVNLDVSTLPSDNSVQVATLTIYAVNSKDAAPVSMSN